MSGREPPPLAGIKVGKQTIPIRTPPRATVAEKNIYSMAVYDLVKNLPRSLKAEGTFYQSRYQVHAARLTIPNSTEQILVATDHCAPKKIILEMTGFISLEREAARGPTRIRRGIFPYDGLKNVRSTDGYNAGFHDQLVWIDATMHGNDAQFVRRSCRPNAVLKHVIGEFEPLGLAIVATSHINYGDEITLPLDPQWTESDAVLNCVYHLRNLNSCPFESHRRKEYFRRLKAVDDDYKRRNTSRYFFAGEFRRVQEIHRRRKEEEKEATKPMSFVTPLGKTNNPVPPHRLTDGAGQVTLGVKPLPLYHLQKLKSPSTPQPLKNAFQMYQQLHNQQTAKPIPEMPTTKKEGGARLSGGAERVFDNCGEMDFENPETMNTIVTSTETPEPKKALSFSMSRILEEPALLPATTVPAGDWMISESQQQRLQHQMMMSSVYQNNSKAYCLPPPPPKNTVLSGAQKLSDAAVSEARFSQRFQHDDDFTAASNDVCTPVNMSDDSESSVSTAVSCSSSSSSAATSSDEDTDDFWEMRCHCGLNHEDGDTVECISCKTWQHMACMGLTPKSDHKNYCCEVCEPRKLPLSKQEAARKQREILKKIQKALKENGGVLTAKMQKAKKHKKKVAKKARKAKAEKKKNNPTLTTKKSPKTPSTPAHGYSDAAQALLRTITPTAGMSAGMKLLENGARRQKKAKSFQNMNGLLATEFVGIHQMVMMVHGWVTLPEEVKRKPGGVPGIFLYEGLQRNASKKGTQPSEDVTTVSICIATRKNSSVSHVRRSCNPNCKLTHVVDAQQNLGFVVMALKNIQRGEEITLPFDPDWRESEKPLKCVDHLDATLKCPLKKERKLFKARMKIKKEREEYVPPKKRLKVENNGYTPPTPFTPEPSPSPSSSSFGQGSSSKTVPQTRDYANTWDDGSPCMKENWKPAYIAGYGPVHTTTNLATLRLGRTDMTPQIPRANNQLPSARRVFTTPVPPSNSNHISRIPTSVSESSSTPASGEMDPRIWTGDRIAEVMVGLGALNTTPSSGRWNSHDSTMSMTSSGAITPSEVVPSSPETAEVLDSSQSSVPTSEVVTSSEPMVSSETTSAADVTSSTLTVSESEVTSSGVSDELLEVKKEEPADSSPSSPHQ